jgi:hypothetical protein
MEKVKAHFDSARILNAHVAFLLETYLAMFRGALADEKLSFPHLAQKRPLLAKHARSRRTGC